MTSKQPKRTTRETHLQTLQVRYKFIFLLDNASMVHPVKIALFPKTVPRTSGDIGGPLCLFQLMKQQHMKREQQNNREAEGPKKKAKPNKIMLKARKHANESQRSTY